jgi:hypothetical protein
MAATSGRAVLSIGEFENMDELKVLRRQVEQMREDTVRCPSCMDLWSVLAYDKVLHAIDEMTKKELALKQARIC